MSDDEEQGSDKLTACTRAFEERLRATRHQRDTARKENDKHV